MVDNAENVPNSILNSEEKVGYELVPPDGGWGFVVALAITVLFSTVIIPTGVFGIIYGPFLATVADEASATAIVNSVFNTVMCFTGLAANHLLQKTSYRKVGILGAILYFIGSFSCIFVTNSTQLIVTWGILQGMGFGLMMPSAFTAFNKYFHKRRSAVMGMVQVLIAMVGLAFPSLAKHSMAAFGFRGSVALISALGLNCIPAMLSFQPAEWHMQKQPAMELKILPNLHTHKAPTEKNESKLLTVWKSLVDALDLRLFQQPSFVNIVCGLALSVVSDLSFVAIFPLILSSAGLSTDKLTLVLSVYFFSDLVGRICLTLLTLFAAIRSRNIFLLGALLSVILRMLFTASNSFWWVTVISAMLGFVRSFIHVQLPLVIAEAFPTRFVTAFSLYMVVCGFVALFLGFLMSLVKQATERLDMVVHLLTLANMFCVVPWIVEISYVKFCK